MHYRRLGDAGLKVSAVSIGSWINFEEGKSLGDEPRRIIARAYELGINFFDTADIYGKGSAERQLGEMLKPFPRHTLVVSTKLFRDMSNDVNDRGLSRKHIMESIDKSLQRLQMDYIDIYFCHRADHETPMLETVRAMDDLIHKGKILYWGTSEWDAKDIQEALRVCEKHNLHQPQTDQPQYSLLFRQRVEQEILPLAQPAGIGLVPYSPLAYGVLTGKYDNGIPDDSRFAKETWAKDRMLTAEAVERVKRLKPIADRLGLTRAQVALAWLLRQPGVSSVITGATRISQIEENAQAADVTLPAHVLAEIDGIFPAGVRA